MTRSTPLLGFLRALTVEQQTLLAQSVGTTRVYLYQLAAQPAPNPKLRFALALVAESKKYALKAMTRELTLDDLLVGTGEPEPAAAPGPH